MADQQKIGWRVVANGAMLEIVLSEGQDGKQRTSTRIFGEGTIIEGDLERSFVERYDANEPVARSLVERVALTEDEDGKQVATPIGRPEPISPEDNAEALARAEAAESEVTELRTRVSELETVVAQKDGEVAQAQSDASDAQSRVQELEGTVQTLQGQLDEAKKATADAEANALSFNDLSKPALEAEVAEKNVTVEGTGANGNVKKEDLVKALEGARASS